MKRAGEILGTALRRIGRPESAIAWLIGTWPQLVGNTLARHARPIACSAGRLEIGVDGKDWKEQIESMREEFFAHINQAWGAGLVREIKIRMDPALHRRISYELDNEHTPFVRKAGAGGGHPRR